MPHRKVLGCLMVVGLAGSAMAAGQAGSALAAEMGCYNCHGVPTRADAPSFERLAANFEKRRGDTAAEQHVIDELRRGEPLQHIPVHERLSAETARSLVRWLFDGAK
jgi:cytochrome c551/c552